MIIKTFYILKLRTEKLLVKLSLIDENLKLQTILFRLGLESSFYSNLVAYLVLAYPY